MLEPKIEKLEPRAPNGKLNQIDRPLPVPDGAPEPKVSIFNRTWAWFSGKKTVIGGVAFIAGDVLVGGKVGGILKIIGMLFTGIGLTHKAEKKLNEKTPGEKINWGELIDMLFNYLKTLFKKG